MSPDPIRRELLRFLTAGSVDDGKSTLIGRLLYDAQAIHDDHLAAVRRDSARRGDGGLELSLLMDGLKAEREQGITIDVAHRYFSTARRKFIIADCPGHEQYTRNMATGASNCDLAVILVDARKGVLPQTKRHSFIISLLGIKHAVVAVNKMDLVEYSAEVFESIVRDYSQFAVRLALPDLRFIPMSARHGDNLVEPGVHMPWYHGETLMHYLENVHIASDRNLVDLRLPIQYVNRSSMDVRGFSGTIASGVLRTGDDLVVLPSGVRTRVRSILGPEGPCTEAFPPMAVTLTLTDEVDVSRGDMLAHPGNMPRLEQSVEAMVVWMHEDPLVPGRSYFVKQTTSTVAGHVSQIRYGVDVDTLHRRPAATLAMNEVGRCSLQLSRRLCVDPYERNRTTGAFILIDRLTNATVGAGMIIDRTTTLPVFDEHPDAEVAADPSVGGREILAEERQVRFGQHPVTVLLMASGGADSREVARALERRLFDQGRVICVLGRSDSAASASGGRGADDHDEPAALRVIEVARVVNAAGLIFVADVGLWPEPLRRQARDAIGADRLLEVRLIGPYDDASATASATASLILDLAHATLEECVARLERLLQSRGVVS